MFKNIVMLISLISIIGCETVPKFKQAGYASEQDYAFSQAIGSTGTPKRIEALKSWGVNNNQDLRKITLEIKTEKYSDDETWDTLFEYLRDRDNGIKSGISAARQRDNRLSAAKKAKEEYALQFPFKAVITCEIGGRHYGTIVPCFNKDRDSLITTELEIRNGKEYRLYKNTDLREFRQTNEGAVIPLRNNFEINATNSSSRFVLTLKILKTATDEVVWQESAARFKRLNFSN